VPEDIQLCTFHELHVLERRDLAEVEELARRVVPEGVEVLVEVRRSEGWSEATA